MNMSISNQIIQIGIDLGTTNSEIAVNAKGNTEVIKNPEGDEYTPSVFGFDKAKNKIIGKRAYEKLYHFASEDEVNNYVAEVKRLMGTSESRTFDRVKKQMNAEEISAEILISLKESALKRYPELPSNTAVISIPAYFSTLEAEATKRAGNLAGFDYVVLIQEPIAAAIAYGFLNSANENWLVYDLGGGTFDVALISSQDGALSVKGHNGDNFLGGKDIDWAIVDKLIVPRIQEKFSLSEFSRSNEKYRTIFAKLKYLAEQAKKYLSEEKKTTIEIENVGKDDEGEEIYLNIDISRSDFEELIEPLVDKTIRLAQKTIKDSGVKPSSIRKIVLVGGPTQIPFIRERLEKQLKIEVDTSVDPLTVVAKGACIFAGSQKVPADIIKKNAKETDEVKREIQLNYEPMTSSNEEVITGMIPSLSEATKDYYIQIQSESGFYTSPKIKLKNGKFFDTLSIEERKQNLFWVYLFDDKGKPEQISTDSFSVTHGLSITGAPIPHSIGVAIARRSIKNNFQFSEEFFKFFDKGSILPLSKTERFKTVKNLRKGDTQNVLPIRVYEGESEHPDRNIFICDIKLSGDAIRFDLEEGTDIDVTIEVNESREVQVSAFIPSIDLSVRSVRETLFDEKIDLVVLEKDLNSEVERYESVKEAMSSEERKEVDEDMEEVSRSVRNAVSDEDEKRKAAKQMKDLKGKLDHLSKQKEMPSLKKEFTKSVTEVADMIEKFSIDKEKEKHLESLQTHKKEGDKAIKSEDKALLSRVVDQVVELGTQVLVSNPAFWVWKFDQLADGSQPFSDTEKADFFIKKGRRAVQMSDVGELKECVGNLMDLLPEDAQKGIGRVISGITHT
jgi:molecular chaperone DnaK